MFAAAYTFALASEKKKADMHMAVHTLLHCLLKKKQAGMHMAVHTLLHCLLEKTIKLKLCTCTLLIAFSLPPCSWHSTRCP